MNKMLIPLLAAAVLGSGSALAHGWDDGYRGYRGPVVRYERHYAPVYPVYYAPPVVAYRPAPPPRVVYVGAPRYYPAPSYGGNRVMGQVIGAVAGGLIGNSVSGGAPAATAIGAVLGGAVGGNIAGYR